MEIEEGRALARREERRRKRRPKLIAAAVAAAVILALGWWQRRLVTVPLAAAWGDFMVEVEKTRDPRLHFTPERPAVAAEVAVSSFAYAAPAPSFGWAEPERAAAPAAPSLEPTPAPPPPPPDAEPPPAPSPPEGATQHRFYGVVYDLATKKPVANIKLLFKPSGGEDGWPAVTNSSGHYQWDLYESQALMTVWVEAPGYRKGLLEDKDPSFRERSRESRDQLIEETTDSDLEPVPLRYAPRARVVPLDLALVPEPKKN